MAKPDAELERIAEVARAGATRSPLYRWMHKRYDEFSALMAETRPNWKALAEGFTALGVTMADGRPLNHQVVRHTWYRLRRDMAGRPPPAAPAKPVVPPPPVVAPVEETARKDPPAVPPQAKEEPDVVKTGDELMDDLRRQLNERSGRR